MATLTIRNVPEHIKQALRVEAAKDGRSLEEGLRQVLAERVAGSAALSSLIDAKEILRRAAELESDPPADYRYRSFTDKELSDALSGEYDDL